MKNTSYDPKVGDLVAWYEEDGHPPALGMIVDYTPYSETWNQPMYVVEWYGLGNASRFEHPLRDIKRFNETYRLLRRHESL